MTMADLQSRFAFDRASSESFRDYHAANPAVYQALRRFALEAKRAGRRVGMKALFERVRWETSISAKGDSFSINNNYTSHFARLLMESEPELVGFFETRKAKADEDAAA